MVLGLAWAGQGYWALVLGNLFGAVILSAVVTVRFGLVPAWPRTAELATPLSYARHILVGRIAWVLYRNSDILIAGRLLGSGLLGYYSMAWNVASLPGEKLGNVLTAATAPFFAAIQADRPALRHYFLRVTEALSLVLYPLLFGFLAVADLAVPLVLGEKWIPAVPVLRILIVFAAINAITTPVSQVLNVTGHTRTGMLSGLIALGVLPPAFLVGGMLWGMSGIAGAWIVGYPIVMLLPVRTALRTLEIPLGGYLGSARRAVEGVAVLAGAVWLMRLALPPGTSGWLELVGAVLAGAVGYLGLLWWRHRGLLAAVPGLLRGRG
jgi:O-antigen/teichoic acid export membrane protein